MKDLIYFPSFEPSNERWLKFALLYMDEFRPIIPDNRQNDISPLYKRIIDKTDLINPYSPNYNDGANASKKAISKIEELLKTNSNHLFNYKTMSTDRNYLVYSDKFSNDFEYFCTKNNFGTRNNDGLLVSEELGFIFMQHLAQEISYKTNSSIITDNQKFNNYANFERIESPSLKKKVNLAENIINLKLPQNINEIEFDKLIKFRDDNIKLIKVFSEHIQKIEQHKINSTTAYSFTKEYNEIYSELITKITFLGAAGVAIPFSICSALQNNDISLIEYTKELFSSIGGIAGTFYSINDVMSKTKEKRALINYFANLEKIR
ncbi:hypothetical protein [Aliarcobacter cryaerophilus]|uniref:hypothetical protein n=1 Tax=Aliarcobacter cryaerophilus TaxID=28198 RepID=UPI0031798CE8